MKPQIFAQRVREFFNTPKGKKASINFKVGLGNAAGAFVTEILFVLLPIFVLAIVRIYKGTGGSIWALPEWSFIAAVLFGQSIPRIFETLSEIERPFNPQTTAASAAVIIVIGLIPSLLFLVLVLLSERPSGWLIFAQLLMFLLSVLTFMVLTIARHVLHRCVDVADFLFPDYIETGCEQPSLLNPQVSPGETPPNT